MHFWLLIEGEPLVTDFDESRLHRMGALAEVLHSRGHQISVWSSTTNHRDKTLRSNERLVTNYLPGYDVVLIDSPTYQRNISVSRIIHNVKTAKKFKEIVSSNPVAPPDLILSAYPAIELTMAGVQVAKKLGVPVVVDLRDLWPDIFVEILPRWIQFIARIAVYPFNRKARYIADNATAVVGITDEFVDWFEQKATYQSLKAKVSFPLSYKVERLSNSDRAEALRFWLDKGLAPSKKFFTICMFGNLAENAEIPLLVDAARKILTDNIHNVRFVVCGVGEILDQLSKTSKDLPNFYLPGWVTKGQVRVLMEMSNAGALPYRSDRGFELSLPNKVGEYLSEGLPILSSINGVASRFLDTEGVGYTYLNQDVEGLVDSIYALIEEKDLQENMRKRARAVFQRKFNAETVYNDYANYLESLVL
jgi:glycosyltransferase involved in cell wall biosynthesis